MGQVGKTAYKANKDSRYADNTTGQITPATHRAQHEESADSFPFKNGDETISGAYKFTGIPKFLTTEGQYWMRFQSDLEADMVQFWRLVDEFAIYAVSAGSYSQRTKLSTGQTKFLSAGQTHQTLTDAATITWDWSQGLMAEVEITTDRSLSITNPVAGMVGQLIFYHNVASSTIGITPPANSIPTSAFTTPDNVFAIMEFHYNGTDFYIVKKDNFR